MHGYNHEGNFIRYLDQFRFSKKVSKLYAYNYGGKQNSAALISNCHCHNSNIFFSYTFILILLSPEGRAGEAREPSN